MSTRKNQVRKTILNAASDAARDFSYYSRKEDEDLSTDDITEALAKGWITLDEIAAAFRADLVEWAGLSDGAVNDTTSEDPAHG